MARIYVAATAQKPHEMMREAGDGVKVWSGLILQRRKAGMLSYFSL